MRWAGPAVVLAACGYSPSRIAPADVESDASEPDAPAVEVDAPAVKMDAPPDMKVLPACATDPAYVPSPAGVRYFLAQVTQPWQLAQDECATTGAHLAVIDDAIENVYVDGLSGNIFWIGASDLATEGTFLWVTGAAVDAGFTSWRGQQPNNDGGNQNCVEMDPTGATWNDFPCGFAQRFLCECPP